MFQDALLPAIVKPEIMFGMLPDTGLDLPIEDLRIEEYIFVLIVRNLQTFDG